MSITERKGNSAFPKNPDRALLYKNLQKAEPSIDHKFLVMSSRGGVGKTSVIVNVAVALSKRGVKVGLMDVNFRGPDIRRMLGLEPSVAGNSNKRFIPLRYSDKLKVASIESVIQSKDESGGWAKPLKISDIRRFISSVNWGSLECLFVDTPSGPGEALLSVIRAIPDAKTVVVTAPNKISGDRAKNMINFFRKEKIPISGWIENMRGFFCQHCGEPLELFSCGTASRALFLGDIPLLGRIPIDPHMAECAAAGEPFVETYPESEVAQGCNLIAEKIMEDGEIILNEDKPETIGGL